MKINGSLEIPDEALEAFCRKWKVREFALFGSVLTPEFGPDSDVDVLLRFEEDEPWDLFDLVDMQEELQTILGRRVDIADREAVEKSQNPYRRRSILAGSRVIYRR